MQKLSGIVWLVCCFLVACSSEVNYAPVTDIAAIEHIPKSGTYRISSGETLYSIAWRYGLDYRYLASLNHISPPFHVVAGQRIYLSSQAVRTQKSHSLKPAENMTHTTPVSHVVPVHSAAYFVERDSNTPVTSWHWPARGPVVGLYSSLNKGINISGLQGSPVYAAAAGQVVYSGNGLRGYGNLIIIKHNSTYLSAYAHNSVVFVKEGQRVKTGQEIAEIGSPGSRQPILHFEIRRNGQPVNPLHYLSVR